LRGVASLAQARLGATGGDANARNSKQCLYTGMRKRQQQRHDRVTLRQAPGSITNDINSSQRAAQPARHSPLHVNLCRHLIH
jgi:hypothetical protein